MKNEPWREIVGTPVASNYWWFYRNVFSGIQSTGTSTLAEGSDISDPFLKIKYNIRMNWSALVGSGAQYGDTTVVIAVIASNRTEPAINPVYISSGSAIEDEWFLQEDPDNATFNGNSVRVLKMRKHVMRAADLGGLYEDGSYVSKKMGKIRVRWRGKKTFMESDEDPMTVLRGWNYYILVGYRLPTTANTSNPPFDFRPIVTMDSYLYFKDF